MKKTMQTNADRDKVVRRTGNVFAQLNRPDSDDQVRKARVLEVINDVIKERGYDQGDAANKMGIDQADISRLIHGKLARFSLDRLMTLVGRLGEDIELHQKIDTNGRLVVTAKRFAHT